MARREDGWVETPRRDGARTFTLTPSAHWWYTVHVHPSGRSEAEPSACVVRSPMGIAHARCARADDAFAEGRRAAVKEARARLHEARSDVADAEEALRFLGVDVPPPDTAQPRFS